MRHRDRLGGTGLDAQAAEDAAQHVDLVYEPVALSRAHRIVVRVVCPADVDAIGRAHTGAQLTADALLHPVWVAVEDVTTMETFGLDSLLLWIARGDVGPEHLAEGDQEAPPRSEDLVEPAHDHGNPKRRSPTATITTMIHTKDKGISRFQPNSISWS